MKKRFMLSNLGLLACLLVMFTGCGDQTSESTAEVSDSSVATAQTVSRGAPNDQNESLYYYVDNGDPACSDTTNDGSMDEPYCSIQAAINAANGANRDVIVAGGSYTQSINLTVDLYCGYSGSFTFEPEENVTTINAGGANRYGIVVPSYALVKIDSCRINGGTSGSYQSVGVLVYGDVTLTANRINGGSGDNGSIGVVGNHANCTIFGANNIIVSGQPALSGKWATGITNANCAITAVNNTIIGNGESYVTKAFGSNIGARSSILVNNILAVGDGASYFNRPIVISGTTTISLIHNLLISTGVSPNSMLWSSDGSLFSEVEINNCSLWSNHCDESYGNIVGKDALLTDDYRLTPASPAVYSGIDPSTISAAYTNDEDIDGEDRELFWEDYCDIGADQFYPNDAWGVFVDAENTGGDGTEGNPYSTIQDAINEAYNFTPYKSVFVAEGTYNSSVITKANIFCGYRTDNWSQYAGPHSTFVTTINASGATRYGISVHADADVYIDSCRINGGASGSYQSIGVLTYGRATLTRNRINGGSGDNGSNGVVGNHANCTIFGANNIIVSGQPALSGKWATGITNANCAITAVNNTIIGNGESYVTKAFGSNIGARSSILINNILAVGDGASSNNRPVVVSGTTTISLIHNLLISNGVAPNSRLWSSDGALYSAGELNDCSDWSNHCDESSGNVVATAPKFRDVDYHLGSASIARDNGIDPALYGYLLTHDFERDRRPEDIYFDIGADEVRYIEYSWLSASSISTGDNPLKMCTGDFNNDGNSDIAVTYYGDDEVGILLGTGTGSFTRPANQPFATGDGPNGIACGDFNDDGIIDLAVVNYNDDDVSMLFGDGAGNFGGKTDYAVDDHPFNIYSADLNGDFYPDIAVSTYQSVSVLLNNGNGTFASKVDYATGRVDGIVGADFDRDGDIDLATPNPNSDRVSMLINNGTGTFSIGSPLYVGDQPGAIAVGDLDFDRDIDIVVGNYWENTISVLINEGLGTYESDVVYSGPDPFYPTWIQIAEATLNNSSNDQNYRSFPDIIVSGYGSPDGVVIWDGLGDGTVDHWVRLPTYSTYADPNSVLLVDLDNDGALDMLTTDSQANQLTRRMGADDF
jgi:FG-GAP-like repeat